MLILPKTLKNSHIDLPSLMGDKQSLNSFGWNSRQFSERQHVIAGSCDVGGYLDIDDRYWHSPIIDKDTIGTTNMCGLMVLDKLVRYVEIYKPHTVWFSCARLLPKLIFELDNKQVCIYSNSNRLIRFLHAKRLINREQREELLNNNEPMDDSDAITTFINGVDYVARNTRLVWMPTATPEAQEYWNIWLQKILNASSKNKYVTESYCGRVIPVDENFDNTIGSKTKELVYDAFRNFKFKL
jgi:hypothetical protein